MGSRPVTLWVVAVLAGVATAVAPGQLAAAELHFSILYPARPVVDAGASHASVAVVLVTSDARKLSTTSRIFVVFAVTMVEAAESEQALFGSAKAVMRRWYGVLAARFVKVWVVAEPAGVATSVAPGQPGAAELQLSILYPWGCEPWGVAHVIVMLEPETLPTSKSATSAGHGLGVGVGVASSCVLALGVGVDVAARRGLLVGLGVGLDTLQLSPWEALCEDMPFLQCLWQVSGAWKWCPPPQLLAVAESAFNVQSKAVSRRRAVPIPTIRGIPGSLMVEFASQGCDDNQHEKGYPDEHPPSIKVYT